MRYKAVLFIPALALFPAACGDQPTQPESGFDLIGPSYDLGPLWGPDSKIAYTLEAGDADWTANIFVMNPDGTGATNLTGDCVDCYDPNWSPDGTRIAFERTIAGDWEIFAMNADGTDVRRVTHRPGLDGYAVWHPNGDKLVFMGEDEGRTWDVWTINADGTGLTNLTNTPNEPETYPTWSPDGSQIALGKGGELFTMNADGSDPTFRWGGGTNSMIPSWKARWIGRLMAPRSSSPPGRNGGCPRVTALVSDCSHMISKAPRFSS